MEDVADVTTTFYGLHCYDFNRASLLHYCRAHFSHILWWMHFNTMLFMSDKVSAFTEYKLRVSHCIRIPFPSLTMTESTLALKFITVL